MAQFLMPKRHRGSDDVMYRLLHRNFQVQGFDIFDLALSTCPATCKL